VINDLKMGPLDDEFTQICIPKAILGTNGGRGDFAGQQQKHTF